MRPLSICLTYFKTLGPANLAAALYSVRQQDLSRVWELCILDNDTPDDRDEIWRAVEALEFPVTTRLTSSKHGDPRRTHSWSTNTAVRLTVAPWVLCTRADYLLDFDLVRRFLEVVDGRLEGWDGFVVSHGRNLHADVGACEATGWRQDYAALHALPGARIDYSAIDSGVWMARRSTFERVGGLDEALTAWGHSQTYFQYKVHKAGAETVVLPEALYHHTLHSAERDIERAHRQLAEQGVNLRELWARFEGPKPY